MSSAKIITCLLVGTIVGVLIAPAKGSETRKKFSRSVSDLSDYLKDIIEGARDEANELADRGIENIEKIESSINVT
jgi:gas vesicle protein